MAARLGDERVLTADEEGLRRIWDRVGSDGTHRSGSSADWRSRFAVDPYYRFSRDDLFETAPGSPSAWDVTVRPYEWEHARPQRFIRTMQRWVRRLRRDLPEEFWSSRLSMLTGASEPANLQLLSPYGHGHDDTVAGRIMGGAARIDAFGNRPVPSLAEVDAYTQAARAQDFTYGDGGTARPFPLVDVARADEPLIAFDQHTLAELVAALHDDEWQAALRATAGVQPEWNRLVARLNDHLDRYGMPAALRLPAT